MSIAALLGVRPPDERVEKWHVSPAVDLMAYAFSWVWVLVPMALVGDGRGDFAVAALIVLVATDVHRHYGLPYVYMDSQIRRTHPLRFYLFPAILFVAWLLSPHLTRTRATVEVTAIGALVAGVCVLFQIMRQEGDPGADRGLRLWTILFPPAAGAVLLSALLPSVEAGWWWLGAAGVAAVALDVRRRKREEASGEPRRYAWSPWVVFAMLGVLVVFGGELRPSTRGGRIPVRFVIYAVAVVAGLWNFWHVYMQKYGILRLYNAKDGGRVTGWVDRLMLFSWLPLYFAFLAPLYRKVAMGYFQEARFVLPDVLDFLEGVQPVTVPFSVAFLAVSLGLWFRSEWKANRIRNLPRLSMMLGTNLLAACFLLPGLNPVKVYLAFAFSHAVEYMVFVWAFQRRRYQEPLPHKPLLGRVLRHPATAYLGFILVLGGLFTYLKFWGRVVFPKEDPPRAFGFDTDTWMFYWGVYQSFMHFYYDGFLWKMRTARIRASI